MANNPNTKIDRTTTLTYGNYHVLVAVTTDSDLMIATPTIEECLGYRVDSSREKLRSKSFKAFAGADFHLGKMSVNVLGIGGNAKTNFYPFTVFLTLLKWEASQGNQQAINLLIAGFADSFSDFAYKSLGIKVTQEHRQLWLKARQEGKVMRRELTDAIADYLARTPTLSENYRVYIYGNVTNTLYKGLFARNAQELKASWGIQKKQETPREKMTPEELTKIQGLEDLTARLIDSGSDPMQAAGEAIARLIFPVIER